MILFQPVVKGSGFPCFGEENHADCLPKVVELQASAADGGHYGGVVHDLDGNVELAGAEDKVRVCGRSGGEGERVRNFWRTKS